MRVAGGGWAHEQGVDRRQPDRKGHAFSGCLAGGGLRRLDQPDQARRWMCPFGASVPDLTLEARVGGRLRAPSSRRPGVEPSLRRTCPP